MSKYTLFTVTFLFVTFLQISARADENERADDSAQSNTIKIGEIQFTLAPGLKIDSVASEPLIKWPVVADWDSAGRLVVVESGGVEKPIEEHNKQLLHRVIRLVDEDGDGKFDRRIVAAENLPFSVGILCLDNSLLVSAPPLILKLSDGDGDGVCENREIWFDGQTITGCANDLHGPYLGRDGWVYWCKGAFAEQTHELVSGGTLRDEAAHIFRRHPDGGPIEPVMSGGMDNPVEVAVTPEGERFFTSTFLHHPANGKRDGIVHAVFGGVYGKENHVLNGLTRTGPLMPIMTELGPAAPSGLLCLEKNSLVEPSVESSRSRVLVAALFNLQKVTAHQLMPHGGSFTTNDIDLLTSDRIDFHPTDILEEQDGSLLVLDTGGWYDLCCPTSSVDQKTAAGGIYRLSSALSKPEPKLESVDWAQVSIDDCASFLNDPRPWVSRMALLKLQRWGDAAVPAVLKQLNADSAGQNNRMRALWALGAIGTVSAMQQVSACLNEEDESLVSVACHLVSLHRYKPAKSKLETLVIQNRPLIQRVAAEALGQVGDVNSVEPIMQAIAMAAGDPVREHSLIYALIEINDAAGLVDYLDSKHTSQQRGAMIALDQLSASERLSPSTTFQSFLGEDVALQQVALDILQKHPEWATEVAVQMDQRWRSAGTPENYELMIPLLQRWKDQPAIKQLVGQWIGDRSDRLSETLAKIVVVVGSNQLPVEWVQPVHDWLVESPMMVSQFLSEVDLTAEHCAPIVSEIKSLADQTSGESKINLLAALPRKTSIDSAVADSVVDQFVSSSETERQNEKRALDKLILSPTQAKRLIAIVADFSPSDLQFVISAVGSVGADELDIELLSVIEDLPAARALSSETIKNEYRNRSPAIRQRAEQTIQLLSKPEKDVAAALDQILSNFATGDPSRGLQVFRSPKAQCSACHQMGYVGGSIGPELTRIGSNRTRRALVESILFPSSRIEQGFQATRVLTLDGLVYNGVIRHYISPHEFEMQLDAEKTVVLHNDEIEVQKPSTVSIMPTGMKDVLSAQDLADLIALLEQAK